MDRGMHLMASNYVMFLGAKGLKLKVDEALIKHIEMSG
jgi:hypothetical protein